ncbi:MAG: hypothetical protein ACOC2P_00495 [Spirochaetota bacterium]
MNGSNAVGRVRLLLAAAALAALLYSCSWDFLQPGVEVQVRIPAAAWADAGVAVRYKLVFPDGRGELQELCLATGERSAVIRVQRGYNVPIAAYPFGRLKPVGAFVTQHVEKNFIRKVVPLRARYGASAHSMLELRAQAERCETVQTEALTREMEAEGEGDPWKCDLERIKSAIVRGRLNRLQVCDLEDFDVSLLLPAGDWLAGNSLWNGTVSSDPAGELKTVEFSGLYAGRHCFYSPASGLELHLYVDKNGGCRWVCDSLRK